MESEATDELVERTYRCFRELYPERKVVVLREGYELSVLREGEP